MPPSKVARMGVLSAMPSELARLKTVVTEQVEYKRGECFSFTTGKLEGKEIVFGARRQFAAVRSVLERSPTGAGQSHCCSLRRPPAHICNQPLRPQVELHLTVVPRPKLATAGASNVGTVFAASAVTIMISEFGATAVVFTGVAGGLKAGQQIGDLVLGAVSFSTRAARSLGH